MEGMRAAGLAKDDDNKGATSPLDCRFFKERQMLLLLAVHAQRLDMARAMVAAKCSYWLKDAAGAGLPEYAHTMYVK